MTQTTHNPIRATVREHDAKVAPEGFGASCFPGCCVINPGISLKLGYPEEDLGAAPEGANPGSGYGSLQALASASIEAKQPGGNCCVPGCGCGEGGE